MVPSLVAQPTSSSFTSQPRVSSPDHRGTHAVPAVGYTLDSDNALLLSDEHSINALEIMLEAGAVHPPVRSYLESSWGDQPNLGYISLRTQRLILGGLRSTPSGDVDLLLALARLNRAAAVSHQLTLPIDSVAGVCQQVEWLQNQLDQRKFYLGFTSGPESRGSLSGLRLDEFRQVVVATGCGVILDLTELLASCGGNQPAALELAAELLSDTTHAQLLINGALPSREGQEHSLLGLIPHRSSPVPAAVWQLYQNLLSVACQRISAVFVTRRQNHPDECAWRGDLRRARSTAEPFAYVKSSDITEGRSAYGL
ncbi:MAG: hypothetical protein ACKOUR_07520 [Planctomycetota bacterium]